MSNHFKSTVSLVALFSTIFFIQCSDEDDKGNVVTEDWAAVVEGTYAGESQIGCGIGAPTPGTAVFTRIGDKQLNMQGVFGSDTYCLDSIVMNASTTFIINEFDGCISDAVTGNGNFTNDSVYFFINYPGWCSFTITGTK